MVWPMQLWPISYGLYRCDIHIVMAGIVMAYSVVAYTVMPYIVMAYVVMANMTRRAQCAAIGLGTDPAALAVGIVRKKKIRARIGEPRSRSC